MRLSTKRAERHNAWKKEVAGFTHQSLCSGRVPQRPSLEYQLDHIVPKSFGFSNDVPAFLIGSPENLEWIPLNQNYEKGTTLTAKGMALLEAWKKDGFWEKGNAPYGEIKPFL